MPECSPIISTFDVEEELDKDGTKLKMKYTLAETEDGKSYKYNSGTHHLRCVEGQWRIYANMPDPPLANTSSG